MTRQSKVGERFLSTAFDRSEDKTLWEEQEGPEMSDDSDHEISEGLCDELAEDEGD